LFNVSNIRMNNCLAKMVTYICDIAPPEHPRIKHLSIYLYSYIGTYIPIYKMLKPILAYVGIMNYNPLSTIPVDTAVAGSNLDEV
jgi:hypothetical protein